MASFSYIFFCSPGRVPPELARGRGSSSSKGRFRGCWHAAGRCPQLVWGRVGGLRRRLAPGACPLLAPHTVQFIHEPPGPALEGAVGKRFSGEPGVGQRPLWREGVRWSLLAFLTTKGRQSQSFGAMFPRRERSLGSGEKRSEGPAALGALCCHLPGSPGRRSGCSALYFPGGFSTPYHSLASSWVCSSLGRMRLCPTPPEEGPPGTCEKGSGSVYQASSGGVLAA